jgi:hypothetical protein
MSEHNYDAPVDKLVDEADEDPYMAFILGVEGMVDNSGTDVESVAKQIHSADVRFQSRIAGKIGGELIPALNLDERFRLDTPEKLADWMGSKYDVTLSAIIRGGEIVHEYPSRAANFGYASLREAMLADEVPPINLASVFTAIRDALKDTRESENFRLAVRMLFTQALSIIKTRAGITFETMKKQVKGPTTGYVTKLIVATVSAAGGMANPVIYKRFQKLATPLNDAVLAAVLPILERAWEGNDDEDA